MPAIPGIGRMGADETAINHRDFGMLKYRILTDICRWGGLPVSDPKRSPTDGRFRALEFRIYMRSRCT
jgi:hypothetical protein